ncbi:nucleotidyltransferase domain-containing protein [Streptomyces benahoarensis]|uniref:nucleotidyltransferase domain-containing protein n=1 Tax=Streptomyces benahoarensis TaxID=2595054 RepID=UPI0020355101|nr:nucleotidyltransferase domain-containing protein [Streptomyces benahoarensis]
MTATGTGRALRRFASEVRQAVPTLAVWAHGSLAMGDFRPGRSDLDLIAVTEGPLNDAQRNRLARLHRRLADEEPAAAALHCSYMPQGALTEARTDHVTWAHGTLLARPVMPVSRSARPRTWSVTSTSAGTRRPRRSAACAASAGRCGRAPSSDAASNTPWPHTTGRRGHRPARTRGDSVPGERRDRTGHRRRGTWCRCHRRAPGKTGVPRPPSVG